MKTVKEVLETGSKEEIEKMLEEVRRLWGVGLSVKTEEERKEDEENPYFLHDLTDEFIVGCLIGSPKMMWSGSRFFEDTSPKNPKENEILSISQYRTSINMRLQHAPKWKYSYLLFEDDL